jgi:hypothetical protein
LAVRSELGLLIDGAGPPLSAGRERAEDDDERARALFESLGVARAVITWSSPVSGEPILTPSRSRESPVVPKVAEPLCNPFGV